MEQNEDMARTFLLNKHEKSYIFECAEHANNISKKLKTFSEHEDFFDIVLVVESDQIQVSAHRFVLSASSDYFLAMFRSSGFKEAEATKLSIKDIDGVTLKTLVNFMYTGSIKLCCETIQTILKTADFFQMNTLVKACCKFMEDRLDTGNCLGIAMFAEQHYYTELHKKAILFALENFEKVSTEHEFFQLSKDQICELISSGDLRSEEVMFLAVVAWVEYDNKNREKFILDLLALVHFTSLDPEFIIDKKHSVCKTMECCELISSWLQWHQSPEKRQQSTLKNTKPRKPQNGKLASISWYYSANQMLNLALNILDPVSNTWSFKILPKLNVSKSFCTITFLNQKIIITGGLNYTKNIYSENVYVTQSVSNSVECFNLLTHKWTNLPPMNLARSSHKAVEIDGNLYVAGGCKKGNSVEKYDFSTKKWQYLESLPTNFDNAIPAALQDELYAFNRYTSEMLFYNSTADKWIPRKPKPTHVEGLGCAELCGKLYTVGRYNDYCPVECYNPQNDDWETKKSLHPKHIYTHCTVLKNRLLVAGEAVGYNSFGSVQEYDPETNEWSKQALLNYANLS